MIKFNFKNISLFTKKGAVFGIDARITFAVTAIAAFVVGINQFSDIDRNNIDNATLDLREIKNSMLQYYEDKNILPTNVDDLTTNGYMVYLRDDANYDPWGNTYLIKIVTESKSIAGVDVNVKYVTLISAGKNGVQNIGTPANYNVWKTATTAGSDDIILKFDTSEIDQRFAEIEVSQLKVVQNLINNYVATKKQELADYCDISSNQLKDNCDINEDAVYDENEEFQLNFMLKDIDDANGKYYLTKHSTHGTDAEFKSGYIKADANANYNMYSFMNQIGGNADYVTSPRGLVLHFTSNKYGSAKFPYYAEVWYDAEKTIF
tara:strand:- start:436 stop:1395 length:960 start_codon:yes stop_codon:yes gene_type:complete